MVNAYIAVLKKFKHYVIYCIIFCSILKQKERRSKNTVGFGVCF